MERTVAGNVTLPHGGMMDPALIPPVDGIRAAHDEVVRAFNRLFRGTVKPAAFALRHRARQIGGLLDDQDLPKLLMAGNRDDLLKTLEVGDSDPQLQHNKVTNLRLAAAAIDGTVILPGEIFSFWDLVGRPSARRGFVPGMLLSDGRVVEGTGGGLCQMSNLLCWMFLHSALTMRESHRHSYDVFPDSGRVLPFGSGATVFHNYVDLQVSNRTESAFRVKVRVGRRFLHGELQADREQPYRYHVLERGHRFFRDGDGRWWRENRLLRRVVDIRTGQTREETEFRHNVAQVTYNLKEEQVVD